MRAGISTPRRIRAALPLPTALVFGALLLTPACAPLARELDSGWSSRLAKGDTDLDRSQAAYKERRYVMARNAVHGALERRPDNGPALRLLGWSEYQLGNYRQALDAFQRAASLDADIDATIGIGWCKFKLGALDEAEATLLSARAQARGDQRYVVADGLGWIAYVRGDYDKAAAFFRAESEARRVGGAYQDGHLGLGWIALSRGDLAAARKRFVEGLRQQPDYFRLHDGLGRVALFEGKYEAALAHAQTGLRSTRYNRELVLLLDAALRRIGSPARNIEVYRELSRQYPEIPVFHNGRGWSQLALGRLREAEASFFVALELLPEYPLARIGLKSAVVRMNAAVRDGWKHYQQGNFKQALIAFEAKSGVATVNPAVNTGRGWSLLALGRFAEAERAFRAALGRDAKFASARDGLAALRQGPETVYLKGWDLIEVRQFGRARAQFTRAKKVLPRKQAWRAEEGAAWSDLLDGREKVAARTFERILAMHPKAYLSMKGLGYATIERGAYDQAMALLDASYALQPAQIITSFTVPAQRLIEAKRYDLALRVLVTGARTHGESADIEFLMARAMIGRGDTVGAIRHAERAAKLAPAAISASFDSLEIRGQEVRRPYLAMARGLYAAGDYENALRRLEDYFRVGGADPGALRDRGFALYRLGRFGEAVGYLTEAAKHEPARLGPITSVVDIAGTRDRWEITYNGRSTLAWTLLLTGYPKRASAAFRKVLETYPGWIDAHTGLGYSLLALGDRRRAVHHFREALLLSPGYPDAWQGLSRAGAVR